MFILMSLPAIAFAAQGMIRAFIPTSSKPKPVYHKTWDTEVPGYPASEFVKNL